MGAGDSSDDMAEVGHLVRRHECTGCQQLFSDRYEGCFRALSLVPIDYLLSYVAAHTPAIVDRPA